jgi:hypothetical protein
MGIAEEKTMDYPTMDYETQNFSKSGLLEIKIQCLPNNGQNLFLMTSGSRAKSSDLPGRRTLESNVSKENTSVN